MPTNEVLHEMVRSMKEEMLPDLREELRQSFMELKESMTREFGIVEQKIRAHDDDIKDMRSYIDTQKGSVTFAKWLLSFLSISTIIQWFKLIAVR